MKTLPPPTQLSHQFPLFGFSIVKMFCGSESFLILITASSRVFFGGESRSIYWKLHFRDVCSVMCSVAPDSDTLHQLRKSPHASLAVLQESQGDLKEENLIRPNHKP